MTAIPKDGYLYGVDGHGPPSASSAASNSRPARKSGEPSRNGTKLFKTRTGRPRHRLGTFRCNLLMIDGRCLCLGEFGHLLWLDLNPKAYKQLDRPGWFTASETWTPPVVSRGLLYICQNTPGSKGEPHAVALLRLEGIGIRTVWQLICVTEFRPVWYWHFRRDMACEKQFCRYVICWFVPAGSTETLSAGQNRDIDRTRHNRGRPLRADRRWIASNRPWPPIAFAAPRDVR